MSRDFVQWWFHGHPQVCFPFSTESQGGQRCGHGGRHRDGEPGGGCPRTKEPTVSTKAWLGSKALQEHKARAVSQYADTSKNTKAWAVSQHTDTSKNTKARAGSQHAYTSKNTKAWAVSQHTDTSKNTKTWAVSQHADTSKNTKTWAVSQHTSTRTPRLGLCHNTLTSTRTPRLGLCHNTLTSTRTPRLGLCHNTLIVVVDGFYIALFSTLEQTCCANVILCSFCFCLMSSDAKSILGTTMILHEWLAFHSVFLNIHRSGVLTALTWLVSHETAAVLVCPVYTIQIYADEVLTDSADKWCV